MRRSSRFLLRLAVLASAPLVLAPTAGHAQTVVVDSGGVQPGLSRVRARLHQLRGGRTVQPIVILVPSRAAASVSGRDGVDGRDGASAPALPPAVLPGGLPGAVAPNAASGVPRVPAPTLPVELTPAQRALLETVPAEVVREVERQIVEAGLFRTSNVPFEFDRARIIDGADRTLDVVGDVLRRYPSLVVEVGGHTDAVGTDAYNRGLSLRRADAVRAYLAERWSIAPERLVAAGYGEARPLGTNANETGRALNRRVEFTVLAR